MQRVACGFGSVDEPKRVPRYINLPCILITLSTPKHKLYSSGGSGFVGFNYLMNADLGSELSSVLNVPSPPYILGCNLFPPLQLNLSPLQQFPRFYYEGFQAYSATTSLPWLPGLLDDQQATSSFTANTVPYTDICEVPTTTYV
jgi:hypothetical protein